jgi:TRAP-type mannitol/chloroaromatic compound transport system permease large subunit
MGLPIGYSMIVASILYLLLAGLDLGTSAEQILNGLYNSYVLLAVPLFLFSAELMNVSKMTDQLLRFCDMLVGRFRGGSATSTSRRASSSPACRARRSPTSPATGRISIDMMTRNNRYPVSYAAADHGGVGGDRTDHPAVDSDGALRADLGHLGRLSCSSAASFPGC